MKHSLLFACLVVTGCTRWSHTEVARPPRQLGMVLVGEPHFEQRETSASSADFAGMASRNGGDTHAAGSIEGARTTVRRTHCVQKAMVDFEQEIVVRPEVFGRNYDLIGGIVLAAVGGIVAASAAQDYGFERDNYESDLRFHQRDPSFFPMPTEPSAPVGFYTAGAVISISGLALLGYSYLALPRGDKPKVESTRRRWTAEQYVDATGCR